MGFLGPSVRDGQAVLAPEPKPRLIGSDLLPVNAQENVSGADTRSFRDSSRKNVPEDQAPIVQALEDCVDREIWRNPRASSPPKSRMAQVELAKPGIHLPFDVAALHPCWP